MNEWAFGYGSLVNERTWDLPVRLERAVLSGWRRDWGHVIGSSARRFCVLTITPDDDCRIHGLVAETNSDILTYLRGREAGYDKITVEPHKVDILRDAEPNASDVQHAVTTHVSQGVRLAHTDDIAPIPQSYIDVVLDGYHRVFGEQGVRDFLSTTTGWSRPILDDRSAPLYSRAVTLEGDFTRRIDDMIAELRDRG